MKRLFITLAACSLCAASSAFAMGFSTVVKDAATAKFSSCGWESDPHLNKVPLKGKPGKRDNVWIYTHGKDFTIDTNVDVKQLSCLYDSRVKVAGKKIAPNAGSLHFELSGSAGSDNHIRATKCLFDIKGGLTFSIWEKCKSMGMCTLYLDDSNLDATGGIIFTMPALYMTPQKNRSGCEINLTGTSKIKCKGDMLIDSTLMEFPNMHFRFVFNEKGGKMPSVSVKNANLGGIDIQVNVKSKLKKGVYPLLEVTSKSATIVGKPRSFSINGKSVSLGTPFAANGQDLTIKLDSLDRSKANDYILEVR